MVADGFQFKVGRACRDFNVQNAYAKLFAPLLAKTLFTFSTSCILTDENRGHTKQTVDNVTSDVPTGKISKSDQQARKVEKDTSRTQSGTVSLLVGQMYREYFEVRVPKDKLLFSRRTVVGLKNHSYRKLIESRLTRMNSMDLWKLECSKEWEK